MQSSILQYLFRDDAVFALDKPAQLHSCKGEGDSSIADLLLAERPDLTEVSPRGALDAGLVNRLDFDTSGILLGAFNREAWEALHRQILSGRVEKRYLALLEGRMERPCTLSTGLGSPRRSSKRVRVYAENARGPRILPASTEFVPRRFLDEHEATLVEVRAHSARRHQIRAHAAHLGHPLLGDSLYGSTRPLARIEGLVDNPERRGFFLHASEAVFTHPISGARIRVESAR